LGEGQWRDPGGPAGAALIPVLSLNSYTLVDLPETVGFSTKNLGSAGNINRPVTIPGAE
jgi:hypothetical protein